MQFPREQFSVKLSAGFGTFPEVQMYLSSEKMGAKASPPCLLLLPYHAACSSCICSSEGWMGSCLHWDCSPRLGVALPPAVVQLSRAGCPGLLCCHRCICHHSRTGSSCASLVLSLSHWGEKHKNNNTKAGGLQQGMGSWEFFQQRVQEWR